MTTKRRRFPKGIQLDPDTTSLDTEGEVKYDDTSKKVQYQDDAGTKSVVSEDGTQTITNKTIDSASNTITVDADEATVENLEVDNLKAGVLDTDLTSVSASDDTIPSAKATKDYVDAQIAGKDEASEITFDDTNPNVTGTNVQDATDDVANSAAAASTAASTAQSTADDHIADAVDAHDGSAISYNPAGSSLVSAEMQAAADEIAGRLDTTETNTGTNTTNLSNHIADTSTHGTTSAIVGVSDVQDLSNKTFTDSITLEEQGSTPSNPASGDKKFYAKTDGKIYTLDSAGNEIEVGSGAGGGSINFIDNSDAEVDASGYSLYDDTTDRPVDGTGVDTATTGITFSRSETSPLIGGASFVLTKDAADRQGIGVSYDFSIDSIFQAKLLDIKFYKDFSDSNIADGDITCFIYDVTNAKLIEPVGFELTADKRETCLTFQTAPDSTSYRLIFHQSSTSATAYSAKLDNIRVQPAESCTSNGPVILSAYGSTNQTLNNTVPFVVEFDSTLEDTRGGWDATNYWYTIPESGIYEITGHLSLQNLEQGARRVYTRVTASFNGGGFTSIGFFSDTNNSTASTSDNHHYEKIQYFNKGDRVQMLVQSLDDASYTVNHSTNRSSLFIKKLDSASGSCGGGSGADISARAYNNSTQLISTNTTTVVTFPTESEDTTNSFDAGGTDRFTAPESGRYLVGAYTRIGNAVFQAGERAVLEVYKEGVLYGELGRYEADSSDNAGGAFLGFGSSDYVYLEKGEYVDFRFTHTQGTDTNIAVSRCFFIKKSNSGSCSTSSTTVSGSAGINFIDNGSAEVSTTGWADFNDSAASPVDGTGGSLSGLSTLTRTTTSPLFGDGSFRMVRSGAAQGEGHSYDFTIPAHYQSKAMEIKLSKDFSDANLADGDISCWIYDVTNATLIEPVGFELTADKRDACLTFQTAPDSTSYRLIFMVTVTDAGAFTADIDNVSVGPVESCGGVVQVSGWKSYTPTGSYTNVTYDAKYREVGNCIEIQGEVLFNGADAATNSDFNLPSGFTVDTSDLTDTSTGSAVFGGQLIHADQSSGNFNGHVGYSSTTAIRLRYFKNFSGAQYAVNLTEGNRGSAFVSGDKVTFKCSIPVNELNYLGSASSCGGGESNIVAIYKDTSAQAIGTSATKMNYPTKIEDTHGAFDGAGNFTAPESGYYSVDANILTDGESWVENGGFTMAIDVAGSGTRKQQKFSLQSTATTQQSHNPHITGDVYLNKGQVLNVYLTSSIATNTNPAVSGLHNVLSIKKLPSGGGSCSTESKPVMACYRNAAWSHTAGSGVMETVPFDTSLKDNRAGLNTSTGVYTVQESGDYHISASLRFASIADTRKVQSRLVIAGGSKAWGVEQAVGATSAVSTRTDSLQVNLTKGDTIVFQVAQTDSASEATTAGELYTYMQIHKVN